MTISMSKYEKTFGWIFLALTPLVLPMLLLYLCQLLPVQPDDAQLNMLVFAVNFVLTLLIFHRFLWKNAGLALSRPGRTFLWMGIGFAAYNISSYLVLTLTTLLAPDFANANDANILGMLDDHFWPMESVLLFLCPLPRKRFTAVLSLGLCEKSAGGWPMWSPSSPSAPCMWWVILVLCIPLICL